MEEIMEYKLNGVKFFYVDSPSWQYVERINSSSHCLIFVIEGTLYMELEGKRYAISKNEFLFMPAKKYSRGYRACDSTTKFYHVVFSSERPPELPNYFIVENTSDIHVMYTMLRDLSCKKNYDPKIKNILLYSLLYEVSYQLKSEKTDQSSGNQKSTSIVEKMKKYIWYSTNRNLTVDDVAHHFGFSKVHTQRLFASEAHTTVKAYINEIRIERIKECLTSTNISLSSLANEFGFPNEVALNKYFKYHTGISIRNFREPYLN